MNSTDKKSRELVPVHKLPLIMVFNVQENAVFIQEFSKNLPTVGGGKPPSHTLPPLRRFRFLALAPVDKSWLHHRHWHS